MTRPVKPDPIRPTDAARRRFERRIIEHGVQRATLAFALDRLMAREAARHVHMDVSKIAKARAAFVQERDPHRKAYLLAVARAARLVAPCSRLRWHAAGGRLP